MTKINHEEYKLLKGLDEKWKWIARDSGGNHDGNLFVYPEKPFKNHYSGEWVCGIWVHPINIHLFQFIQWENDEPWNIQELIGEYESEETEVKKDIEWLKEELNYFIKSEVLDEREIGFELAVGEFIDLLNQLDKPEVLSEYWIGQKSIETHVDTLSGEVQVTFRMDDLQSLVVPKQELPVIPQFVSGWIEETKKQNRSYIYAIAQIYESLGEEENRIFQWMEAYGNDDVFARAWLDGYMVEEEKYYLKIGNLYLAEPLGDMTSDIVRMTRDKEVAYQFTDEKSIATHLDKFEGIEAVKVEELEE